jgi:hypothetical protein
MEIMHIIHQFSQTAYKHTTSNHSVITHTNTTNTADLVRELLFHVREYRQEEFEDAMEGDSQRTRVVTFIIHHQHTNKIETVTTRFLVFNGEVGDVCACVPCQIKDLLLGWLVG